MKATLDTELQSHGYTFEKEVTFGSPKKNDFFISDASAAVMKADFDYKKRNFILLTPKKKKYTLIKVEGEVMYPDVRGEIERGCNSRTCEHRFQVVSVTTVEE